MVLVDLKEFPAIYARLKEAMGVTTQGEAAKRLGKSPQWLSNLLRAAEGRQDQRGPVNIPYKELVEWALKNDVSVDWLLTGNASGESQVDSFTGVSKEERRLLKDALGVLRAEGRAEEFGKMLKQAIETCKVGMEALGGKKR